MRVLLVFTSAVFKMIVGLSASLIIGSNSAMAGEALYFKSGVVETERIEKSSGRLSSRLENSRQARPFVVQFVDQIRPEDRLNLTSLGAEIVRYVPDNALVVFASVRIARTIERSSSRVRVVLPFEAQWKVASEFDPSVNPSFNPSSQAEVLIRLFPKVDEKKVTQQIRAVGGLEVKAAQGSSIVAKLVNGKRSQIEALAELDGIEWIQLNPEFKSTHPDLGVAEEKADVVDENPLAKTEGRYISTLGFDQGDVSDASDVSKLNDLFFKAYKDGARILTHSWAAASGIGSYDGTAQKVDEFMFANPDMLIISDELDPSSISSPGTAKNVLTVGASKRDVLNGSFPAKLHESRSSDSLNTEPLASSRPVENAQLPEAFTSLGPTQDGRLKPEVVAPGLSMAAPLSAEAASVVRTYLVENRKIANPSAALVKAALIHTAVDLFPGQELDTRRPNIDQGYGRVDVAAATDLGKALIVDERNGLGVGETLSYPIKISRRVGLRATLVYTDAPAAAGVSKSLVNDLDLVLVDLATGEETAMNDHVNNSEMLELEVASGSYEVKVRGMNVPQGMKGKQPFALILSVD